MKPLIPHKGKAQTSIRFGLVRFTGFRVPDDGCTWALVWRPLELGLSSGHWMH